MNTITYKRKQYPTRTFMINWVEESEGTSPHQITVSVESLSNELMKDTNDFENFDGEHGAEADTVDQQIYFYLPDEGFDDDAKTVCEQVDEARFISELEQEVD